MTRPYRPRGSIEPVQRTCDCGTPLPPRRKLCDACRDDHRATRPGKGAKWETEGILAVDGEGWGTDEQGRQPYMLLVAAGYVRTGVDCPLIDDRNRFVRYLYTGERLTTLECFEFLAGLPAVHLTSFSFSYDVAQIARDLPLELKLQLASRKYREQLEHGWKQVAIPGWSFDYLKDKRFDLVKWSRPRYAPFLKGVKVASRYIYDAFGFHQRSFVSALEAAPEGVVDPADLETIRAGKIRRGSDEAHDAKTEFDYCVLECLSLARLQHSTYSLCKESGYPLRSFYGAGSLASAMFDRHGVKQKIPNPDRFVLHDHRELWDEAVDASYVGGRFESTGHGLLRQLHEADLRNAYPAQAVRLPCLVHASTEYLYGRAADSASREGLGLWLMAWHQVDEDSSPWGPFPTRTKKGAPVWPFASRAWVWSSEAQAGRMLPGYEMHAEEGFRIVEHCDCGSPFTFLAELYRQRKILKAAGDGREKVYKLGPNAAYGKLAQQVGENPPYRSPEYASMITAGTRAELLKAIAKDPHAVVMVATDALYSTYRLDLDYSEHLGCWEGSGPYEDAIIVQPGLWADATGGHVKTRGIPKRWIDWQEVRTAWKQGRDGITISGKQFSGLGQVVTRRTDAYLGRWYDATREVAFASDKRPFYLPADGYRDWRPSYPASHDGVIRRYSGEGLAFAKGVKAELEAADDFRNLD